MTPEESKIFRDWWLAMSEQGCASEILSENGIVPDSSAHGCNYEEGDPVSVDELTPLDIETIVKHAGGFASLKERLAADGYTGYEDPEDS